MFIIVIIRNRSYLINLKRSYNLYKINIIIILVRITLHMIIVNRLTRILSIRILRLEETHANKEVVTV